MWKSITETFTLESHEMALLSQLVRVADQISSLDSIVDTEGVMIEGKAHPALVESRLQRLALARLMVTLRLPDREDRRPQRRGAFRGTYPLRSVGGDGA